MHGLTYLLLQTYFSTVHTVEGYLKEIIYDEDSQPVSILENGDSPSYEHLVKNSLVGFKSAAKSAKRFSVYAPMMDMHELIDRAQERLLKSSGAQHILIAGYRLRTNDNDRAKRGTGRIGITNYFVNTMVTALQSSEWELMLQRIGVDAMLHLLTETCVFIPLPNGCLCQVTGEPIVHIIPPTRYLPEYNKADHESTSPSRSELKRKATDSIPHENPYKRRKLDNNSTRIMSAKGSLAIRVKELSPADILLVRPRLFYTRPARIPHTQQIIVGLPPKHILNRINPAYLHTTKQSYNDPDPRKQAANVRHLAKYVFPRSFGFSSPFRFSSSQRGTLEFPDFSDRELEIKESEDCLCCHPNHGTCRTPKRLKETLQLLDKMIWRHGKCGYKPIRDKLCPSKIKTQRLDRSVILEWMEEDMSQMRTQRSIADLSVDSAGHWIPPTGLTQAERHARNKPRFAEFACGHVEVYRYVVTITKLVIPSSLWGSIANFKLIMHHVKDFISCRRYETLSLHNILQKFSTTACHWLMPPGTTVNRQYRTPVSDSLKRRELIEDFVYWYFDGFVLPLLKTTFYVTESAAYRNQVLYFRHDDWEILCAPLIEKLTSTTFEQIPEATAKELLRQRQLGFSFVRLLPKETGVRPIVNLRRRNPISTGKEQSINQVLQAAFQILTYEKKSRPELLGASAISPDEVYSKLKAFKAQLPLDSFGKLPKLYFVKVDVQACFDTIEQSKLLEILSKLISEDAYMIQRYGKVSSSTGKITRFYARRAVPEDEHPHFLKCATELASVLRNTILVDQVIYPTARRDDILKLLEEHITENIVKIGTHYYRQMVGIPQGSVLSALLCSFFYGDMEGRFGRFTNNADSVMFRMIDDYLYITTSLVKATHFLDMMNQGHPEYGCFITKDKTLTNFDYDEQIMNVTISSDRGFPWCGYLIDMKTLSVTVDYSGFFGKSLSNSLTIERGRRPGVTFIQKMLRLAKGRCSAIYCDPELNTEHDIYVNIYQSFVILAMKMHGYLRNWHVGSKTDMKFVYNAISQVISYTCTAIRNTLARIGKENVGHLHVQKIAIFWLGIHAFRAVLSEKPAKYRQLLIALEHDLGNIKYRRCRKRFRRLVGDALNIMEMLDF